MALSHKVELMSDGPDMSSRNREDPGCKRPMWFLRLKEYSLFSGQHKIYMEVQVFLQQIIEV